MIIFTVDESADHFLDESITRLVYEMSAHRRSQQMKSAEKKKTQDIWFILTQ